MASMTRFTQLCNFVYYLKHSPSDILISLYLSHLPTYPSLPLPPSTSPSLSPPPLLLSLPRVIRPGPTGRIVVADGLVSTMLKRFKDTVNEVGAVQYSIV